MDKVLKREWVKIFQQLEREGGDLPLRATKQEIEDFKSNRVWIDISNQLIFDLISARNELEAMGKDFERNDITFVQGQCDTIRDLLIMPDTLINSLKKEGEEPDSDEGTEEMDR